MLRIDQNVQNFEHPIQPKLQILHISFPVLQQYGIQWSKTCYICTETLKKVATNDSLSYLHKSYFILLCILQSILIVLDVSKNLVKPFFLLCLLFGNTVLYQKLQYMYLCDKHSLNSPLKSSVVINAGRSQLAWLP